MWDCLGPCLVKVLANFGELRKRAEDVVPFMARSQKRSGGLMPVSESLESWFYLCLSLFFENADQRISQFFCSCFLGPEICCTFAWCLGAFSSAFAYLQLSNMSIFQKSQGGRTWISDHCSKTNPSYTNKSGIWRSFLFQFLGSERVIVSSTLEVIGWFHGEMWWLL